MNHTPIPHIDDLTITGITVPHDPYGTIRSYPTIGIDSFSLDETVRGEMITAQMVFNASTLAQIKVDDETFKQDTKRKLAIQLAEQILNNKLVEFTKQENLNTFEITYRARAYLTPDNQVRMLRKENK